MLTYRIVVTASICLLAANFASAQDGTDRVQTRSPGVEHGGRFFGFTPAHMKASRNRQSPRQEFTDESLDESEAASDVMQVAFEEYVVGNPPLPPGLEGEVLDFSDDGKGVKYVSPNPSCLWIRGEYLLWWTKGVNTPPLVTTSPAGTAQADAGVLGQPGTTTLFGGTDYTNSSRSGARFSIGKWFDPAECHGIEANYLTLGSKSDSFNGALNQFNILARPFFDTVGAAEDSRLIAFPGLVQGTLNASASSEFQSFEVLYRHQGRESWGCHMDWLVGYRFAKLDDRVRISESTASLTGPTAGTTFDLFDQFDTSNTFNGAEFGIIGNWDIDQCWSCETLVKVAIGGTKYRADLAGQTVTTDGVGAMTTTQNGLLVQGTNSGQFAWDDFASMAEFGLMFRRDWVCGLSATFGYNVIYWSNVARAGDLIDTTVNTSQIPPGTLAGAARPAFQQRNDDFWAQGLSFGLEYSY